jgi:outer membrane protein assembly factor BamB
MTGEVTMPAVIEIDLVRPWPGPERRDHHRRPWGVAAFVLLVLLVTLTGPELFVPASPDLAWAADTTTDHFWLTADSVYTMDRSGGAVSVVAFDASTGRPRWTLRLAGVLAEVYARGASFLSSNFPPDATTGVRTNVVAVGGGLPRTAFPAAALPLAYISSRVMLVFERDLTVPTDPEADGRTRAMGLEWTHVVTAYDLATGRPVWSRLLTAGVRWALPGVRAGADGLVGLPPGADWMVVSSTSGDVEVWEVATGHVMARREFGPLKQQAYVAAVADAVIVRLDDSDTATLDGYDPTLEPRWRLRPPLVNAEPVACAPLLCLVDSRSVWVVDPRGGATVWRPTGPLLRPATAGRLVVIGYGNQLMLLDTSRQRTLRTEPGWRAVDPTAYTRLMVVARVHSSGGGADLGVLDAATGDLRRLGQVDEWPPTVRCAVAGDHVACAGTGRLRVWRAGA